jgi:heme-degrading monooxygenase HmoA
MYAVIFRATIAARDEEYLQTADRLRELAISEYGCADFVSTTEGRLEVAISYWESEEQISAWRDDPVHRAAREKGKARWYESWQVEVVRLVRSYGSQTR